jgi:hypothetical protein
MTTVRSLPAGRRAVRGLVAAFVLASGAGGSAHRYDELLQAARIGVESDHVRVEISLTPGIAVADAVLGEIDVNRDGVLSPLEQHSYAEQVLDHITLLVDDSLPVRLALAESRFPDPAAIRNGNAAIDLRLKADMPRLADGAHRLRFRNDHPTTNGVYLANALVPDSPRVAVTGQRRDVDQRELTIEFTKRAAPRSVDGWRWIGIAGALLVAMLARPTLAVGAPAFERGHTARALGERGCYRPLS